MNKLIIFIFTFICIILFFRSVCFRLTMLHPFKTVYYWIKDTFFYFYHCEYNDFKCGQMVCLSAHFGGGKTLTGSHDLADIFSRYNNKKVWDRDLKCFVLQKIHVVSNVHLKDVPVEELKSLSQVFSVAKRFKRLDPANKTRTCVICLFDETSGLLNSRSFKQNMSTGAIADLVVTRHYNLSFFYTSQVYNLTDKLFRDVTQQVIDCHKIWRYMVLEIFDARELEHAFNPRQVEPLKRTGFFVTDKDYDRFDTLAVVKQLEQAYYDFDSDEEVLARRGAMNPDVDLFTPRKKLFKKKDSA